MMNDLQSSSLRAVIIDDEPGARKLISRLVGEHCPDLAVVGEAGSVAAARQLIAGQRPDLVFLDIQLEDGTGFEVLPADATPEYQVIFITAFNDYAITAFRYAALDYLLKPLHPDLLLAAVRKAQSTQSLFLQAQQWQFFQEIQQRPIPDRLLVHHLKGLEIVLLDDLLFLQSEGTYTSFFQKGKPRVVSSQPLADYEELLPHSQFLRVHQSYLLNLKAVRSVEHSDAGSTAIVTDGQRVPVARRKRQEFMTGLKGLAM